MAVDGGEGDLFNRPHEDMGYSVEPSRDREINDIPKDASFTLPNGEVCVIQVAIDRGRRFYFIEPADGSTVVLRRIGKDRFVVVFRAGANDHVES